MAMHKASEKLFFPNISDNLTRSLLKIKSVLLAMHVPPMAIAAEQHAGEIQPDIPVTGPATIHPALPAIPPAVTDITIAQEVEEPYSKDEIKESRAAGTEPGTNVLPVTAIQGANRTSLPGAA